MTRSAVRSAGATTRTGVAGARVCTSVGGEQNKLGTPTLRVKAFSRSLRRVVALKLSVEACFSLLAVVENKAFVVRCGACGGRPASRGCASMISG